MSSKEDMQTVSHLAREIYTSVAAIHPPSPNASQETRETFNSMLRTAQQASGQILSLVIGMAQSTTDSNGQSLDLHLGNGHWDDLLLDEDPGLASSTDNDNDPPPDINDQIQADIEELLAEANDPELWFSLQDFRTMVEQGEHRGSTIQKEKEAFRRMLIGYRQVPLDDIVQAFDLHDLQLASVSIQRHTQHISTFHNLPLRDQRLFEREKLLYNPSSSHCVHAWINVVINNIEAIEFVKDWAGEAGEWRKDFRKTLATHFYASELSLIDRSLFPSTKKDKLRNRLYRRFAKKHDKVIVRRRHLHRFFELVPLSLAPLYFWTPPGLHLPNKVILANPSFGTTVSVPRYSTLVYKMKTLGEPDTGITAASYSLLLNVWVAEQSRPMLKTFWTKT
ncbi:hypothetical protein F5878DRAFT_663718 [Lentinula raphanica]|uniref:Uncharacterized protein n=1 Tax=Lentinula raphanica TaxID=153919 RepID=A0AA38P3R0_9AGAR|nr:hypothetical protein F5878DRAFT_663718 [Lentinula raphanica]